MAPATSRSLAELETIDHWFLEIARRSPTFAGVFRERNEVVVLTTDIGNAYASIQAIRDVNGGRLFRAFTEADRDGRIRAAPARFPFSDLYAWYRTLVRMLPTTGIVFTDIDEVRNRIHIGVSDSSWVRRIEGLAGAQGVPSDAVLVDVSLLILPAAALTDKYRPVGGGVQVEFGDQYDTFVCSVGVTATSDLGEGFITNSHCSWAFGDGSDYTPYYQNVYGQGNFVGYEYADPPLLAAGTAGCPSPPASVGCRISDANFVLAPDHVQVGLIARTTGIGSTTIDNNHPWFLIDSDDLVYLMVGDSVQRIGRSTGWKHGEVTYSCVDVLNWTQAGLVLQCQFLSTAVANLGDSGGPAFVWDGSGSYVQIAGLTVGALIDPNTHWIVGSIFSLWMLGTLDLGGVINDLSVAY